MRLRLGYALAAAVTIALGLGSRHAPAGFLPSWLADHAGDALWAAMVYCGFRLVWTLRGPAFAALSSLLLSCAIECSQLYQAPWLNSIRATTLGGLILGHGFLLVDMVRYTIGVGAALGMDWLITHLRKR